MGETDTGTPDVLIHAGFHKTGTTSLQTFLETNRDALAPCFAYYGKSDFLGAGMRARRFAQRPFPWRLWQFRRSFRRFLTDLPDNHRIVMSRETFAGVMPGHRAFGRPVTHYAHAPTLAKFIVIELRRRFGTDPRIAFLYTTRSTDGWQRSVYSHLLRSIRLRDDFRTFKQSLGQESLDACIDHIRTSLPDVPVHTTRLEECARHPFGPANAVLDIMGVPDNIRQTLTPATRENAGDPLRLSQEFLALNRAMSDKTRLRAAKMAILTRERKADG